MLVRRLDSNYDMSFGYGLQNMAVDAEACAQNIKTRLLLVQGEWFLDTTKGIPWLQEVLKKPADLSRYGFFIQQQILRTPGVQALKAFDANFDRNTRKLSISASVSTIYGDISNIQVTA